MILGLAPMDGFTDCAFRQITKEIFDIYGEKKKYTLGLRTEFMNADGYIINPPGVIKHLLTDTDQFPVIAQIFGANEDMLVKCFSDIQNKYGTNGELRVESGTLKKNSMNSKFKIQNLKLSGGVTKQENKGKQPSQVFSGLELNMGCPARNVMNTGGGSALLKERKQTLAIIKKLSGIMKIPLSIKTRTGRDAHDLKEQMNFLVEISTYVSMITIHGRTVKQGYSADSNWDFIYELRHKADKKCKILGNGGIKNYEDIASLAKNLDGAMIGQAAIGNPRIFTPHSPSREEIKETILKHLDYMISYENYFQDQKASYQDMLSMPEHLPMNIKNPQAITLAEFRKHLFQYVKGIPGSKEFKQKVSTISEYNPLVQEIQKFFE